MQRRGMIAGIAGLLMLAACASAQSAAPAPPSFQSERIIVIARGQGPDIILVHGLSSHTDVWDTTTAALEGRHRVHLVQISGFGGFPARGNAEGEVAAPVAEEIARYIAEAGLDDPAIIGHSMGGTIAMMVAARHPDAVGKVMVVDMFPFMGAMFAQPGTAPTPDAVRPVADYIRDQMRAVPQGTLTPMVEQTINGMVGTESARPRILGHTRASDVQVSANAYHELIVTDLMPELPNIRAPLTVLYVVPPDLPMPGEVYEGYMRVSYASVPSARLVRIDNARHFIMIDQFDAFMGEVDGFLSGR